MSGVLFALFSRHCHRVSRVAHEETIIRSPERLALRLVGWGTTHRKLPTARWRSSARACVLPGFVQGVAALATPMLSGKSNR